MELRLVWTCHITLTRALNWSQVGWAYRTGKIYLSFREALTPCRGGLNMALFPHCRRLLVRMLIIPRLLWAAWVSLAATAGDTSFWRKTRPKMPHPRFRDARIIPLMRERA